MAEVDRVVGNDEKMRSEAWRATRAAFDSGFGIGTSEKIAVADIMAVKAMAPHLLDGFKAGLPRDAWKRGRLEVSTYQVQYFEEHQ